LTNAITFTEDNRFEVDTAPEYLLENFRRYVEDDSNGIPKCDSVLLLT